MEIVTVVFVIVFSLMFVGYIHTQYMQQKIQEKHKQIGSPRYMFVYTPFIDVFADNSDLDPVDRNAFRTAIKEIDTFCGYILFKTFEDDYYRHVSLAINNVESMILSTSDQNTIRRIHAFRKKLQQTAYECAINYHLKVPFMYTSHQDLFYGESEFYPMKH